MLKFLRASLGHFCFDLGHRLCPVARDPMDEGWEHFEQALQKFVTSFMPILKYGKIDFDFSKLEPYLPIVSFVCSQLASQHPPAEDPPRKAHPDWADPEKTDALYEEALRSVLHRSAAAEPDISPPPAAPPSPE